MIKLIDSRNAAQQQVSEVAGTGFKRGTATISAESNGSEQKQNRR